MPPYSILNNPHTGFLAVYQRQPFLLHKLLIWRKAISICFHLSRLINEFRLIVLFCQTYKLMNIYFLSQAALVTSNCNYRKACVMTEIDFLYSFTI